ncbi:PepSY-associated TM helix domain-containing protein [Tropicimonas sp.]|uniref:PepSY-associated TM helix domain-containing protein n=1 Tax=Tropicimonas sp. TaxID=2067044 RepID=UPI003A857870
MSFRRVVFWSHLVVGVAAGLVVLMMSVTGVLLTYELQIARWAATPVLPASQSTAPLGADRLAALALAETGGRATALRYTNDPATPVEATWGRSDGIFLDPASGAVLAEGGARTEAFFGSVMQLHRWLVPLFGRETGAAVTGAANLGFLFLLVSGIYLWWPKSWKWRIVRNNMLFRRSLPNAKARDFNWHHVFGFWALAPLFLIVLSGVVISYPWASRLVFAAYGEAAPAGHGRPGGPQGDGVQSLTLAENGVGLQYVFDAAAAHTPDWNRISLALPTGGSESVDVTVDTGTGRQPTRETTLTYAQSDGSLLKETGIADRSPAMRARMWFRFVHTGEIYGLAGQTIAGLASLAAVFMVYTGLALSYRRLIRPLFRKPPTAKRRPAE